VARCFSRGPHHDHHSFIQQANGNQPIFTIVEPLVMIFDKRSGKDLTRVGEIEAALSECPITLCRVKGNWHFMYIQ